MAVKEYHLTKEGLVKIKEDLRRLREMRIQKIKGEAPRSFRFGEVDPEYLAFQEDMGRLEEKIAELEEVLENHRLVKTPPKNEQDRVYLGATVLVELNGEMEEFTIVNTVESDPAVKKISDESPIGQALMGKAVGDKIDCQTPIVNHTCKIIRINYKK